MSSGSIRNTEMEINCPTCQKGIVRYCDICQAGNGNNREPSNIAEIHCIDCNQNMCSKCTSLHDNFSSTRNHTTNPIKRPDCTAATSTYDEDNASDGTEKPAGHKCHTMDHTDGLLHVGVDSTRTTCLKNYTAHSTDSPPSVSGSEQKNHTKNASKEPSSIATETNTDKSYPLPIYSIETQSALTDRKSIRGLTVLNNRLYIVNHWSSEVEVYSAVDFSFKGRWTVNGLVYPLDISACNINRCLYVCDWKSLTGSEILKLDLSGKVIHVWKTVKDRGCLSITCEGNILMTVFRRNKINEYLPNGELVYQLEISPETGIISPWHSVKLASGNFLISHGDGDDRLHRVCLISANGDLVRSFGGKRGSTIGQMHNPMHLAVDKLGNVMVADQENQRIIQLTSDLEFQQEFASKKNGLRFPRSVHLDETRGRLIVANNNFQYLPYPYWISGKVLVYDTSSRVDEGSLL